MKIRKTYQEVNPELLYSEVEDFVRKQGLSVIEEKLETYTLPNQSASFVSRGTLIFNVKNESGKEGRECLRAHIVGIARGEIKLMRDVDEKLFSKANVSALQEDLDFIFGSYEAES